MPTAQQRDVFMALVLASVSAGSCACACFQTPSATGVAGLGEARAAAGLCLHRTPGGWWSVLLWTLQNTDPDPSVPTPQVTGGQCSSSSEREQGNRTAGRIPARDELSLWHRGCSHQKAQHCTRPGVFLPPWSQLQ